MSYMPGQCLGSMKDFTEVNSANGSSSFGISVRKEEHMVSKVTGSGIRETVFETWFYLLA